MRKRLRWESFKGFYLPHSIFLWGFVALLVFTIAFEISPLDILKEAFSFSGPIQWICAFMLASPIIYILFLVFAALKQKEELHPAITVAIIIEPDLWIPYKGFDTHPLRQEFPEPMLWVSWLIQTILWWAIVIGFVWIILIIPDNILLNAIQAFTFEELLKRIGCITLGIAICNIIAPVATMFLCQNF